MSVIGFIITIATLFVSENARRAVKKIQNSITFDKRIPQHLREINGKLKVFNWLLNDPIANVHEINVLLSSILSELINLRAKVSDERVRFLIDRAESQIKNIRKLSYNSSRNPNWIAKVKVQLTDRHLTVSDLIPECYTQINEIYSAVNNIYKDSQTKLRRE